MNFVNNKIVYSFEIEREEFGKWLREVKTKFPKYVDHLLFKYRNETFDILFLFTATIGVQALLNTKNEDIKIANDITYDKTNYYIKMSLVNYYDKIDVNTSNQKEIIDNFTQEEKEMLDGVLDEIPDYDAMKKIIKSFLKYSFSIDKLIKDYKQKKKEKGYGKENIDDLILKYLFGNFKKDVLDNAVIKGTAFKEVK